MALDPRIALMGRTPDIGPAVNQVVRGIEQGPGLQRRKLNIAQNKLTSGQQFKDKGMQDIGNAAMIAEAALPSLLNGDSAGAAETVKTYADKAKRMGVDLGIDEGDLEMIRSNPDQAKMLFQRAIELNKKMTQQTAGTLPSSIQDRNDLISRLPVDANGNMKPVDQMTAQERAIAVEAGLVERAGTRSTIERIALDQDLIDKVSGSQATIEGRKAGAKEAAKLGEQKEMKPGIEADVVSAKGGAQRGQAIIQEGFEAAKGIPVLRRSIGLLDAVKTGGIDKVRIQAKQMFGIESADEGELSANLGQAVLGDLRATFGAQFTEKEGARLEGIRARLGTNSETNKRLLSQALQIAEDAAKRAMKRAADSGDFKTAQDIQEMLNFEFQFQDQTKPLNEMTDDELLNF